VFLKKITKQLSARESDTRANWTRLKTKGEETYPKTEAKKQDTKPFPIRRRTNTTKHKEHVFPGTTTALAIFT